MKKLLFLFAVLLTSVGAWAQDVFVEPVAGSYYYIKGMSTSVPYLGKQNVNSSIATVANTENAGVFTIEEIDGKKYVKCVNSPNDNVYLFKGTNDVLLGTDANKHVVSIETASQENCTYYINVNNGSYIHNNKSQGIGTGGPNASSENKWGFIKTQRPLMRIEDLDNSKVYYLRTSRGALFYESSNPNVLASTSYYSSVDVSSKSAEWAIYKYNGKYYFYNIAARKFIGKNTNNAGRYPLAVSAYDDVQIYATSTKENYPFVFSTDEYGAINHFHPTSNKNAPGVANWQGNDREGGLRSPNDDGSAHKILEVRDLTSDEISAIQKGFASIASDKEFVLKAGNNYMMDKRTAPTSTKAGRFQFVLQDGSLHTYKIKSIDQNQWVSYDPGQTNGDGHTKATLVDEEDDANNWLVIEYADGLYQISPFDANGNRVTRYWNWHGGIGSNKTYSVDDSEKTVGYYAQGGADDSGSSWSFYEVVVPENGVEYVLYDKTHKLFLDIKNLVAEPGYAGYNKVASLSSAKQTLYVTPKEGELYQWEIHTEVGGGSYLKQYNDEFIATTSIQYTDHYYNSLVAEREIGGVFYWTAEFRISDGNGYYVLKNTGEKSPGYLGVSGHTNAKALRVDQTEGDNQLKLVLHKASDCYSIVANNGYVVYDGVQYFNGDYILSDGPVTAEMLSTAELLGYSCEVSIDEEAKNITITYSVDVSDFKEGDKFFIRNREKAANYIAIQFDGGKLDNSPVPTTKRIYFTNGSNKDYKFCWELKATTHNGDECFLLYNPYYDWYVGPLTGTTSNTHMSKNADGAGRFKIEKEGDYFVFHSLTTNVTAENGALDCNFLHLYAWGGSEIVGWGRSANASQWLIEEVTEEMEAQWQNTLTSQYNNLTQHELGTGIGQYSGMPENLVEGFNALSLPEEATAIEKARYCVYALYDYASAVDALVINQPETGKFYYIQSANTNQYLSNVKSNTLTTTEQKSVNNIFYFENDGENTYLVAYENGHYVTNPWNIDVGEEKINENEIYKQPKSFVEGQIGKYALEYSASDGSMHYFTASGNSTNQKTDKEHNEAQWNLEPVTSLPFTFKKAALGFATFNAPVAMQLPADVLAYITDMVEEENVLQMYRLEGNVIPANTPVMLYNEAAKADNAADETTIELVIVDAYTGDEFDNFDGENDFVGTVAAKTYPTTGETVYSLQKKQKVQQTDPDMVGFYKKESGTDLGGFKAWIMITEKQGAQGRAFTIIFDGDDATGLKEALGLENESVEIYDLSGRRLDKPAKGVNVIGGKLVIK